VGAAAHWRYHRRTAGSVAGGDDDRLLGCRRVATAGGYGSRLTARLSANGAWV
jgi:hypothetical protein